MYLALVIIGIGVVMAAEIAYQIREHRQGWRQGGFSRGMWRYTPARNVNTGKLGSPPSSRLRKLVGGLSVVATVAIFLLLAAWGSDS